MSTYNEFEGSARANVQKDNASKAPDFNEFKKDNGIGKSHATGDSIVPQKIQELAPEGLERALPNAIHDTSKLAPQK
ncbi:hypothetical protein AURDEDRAFT_166407 [Auricularia subglabra TFB-10046 SS5]|uniref:Uncharacterized protein n=1 Tax=Auricularia subglabra (strain TFB-10046 / SS5) TaxID=717982 RepID=J0D3E6_AURST|nr:hypothetical protein AURDEDRAFT_166407 [Auricularia subglabra TFB-10046 SS5]